MQRQTNEGVLLACDFCGTDWDQVKPMIEGHRGSIVCLDCLGRAVEAAAAADAAFKCTMCQQDREPATPVYRNPAPDEQANIEAALCWDCIQQADRAFSKDPDTEWERKIKPTDRWR